ncbi:hypothetical protein [Arthrobacter luteolus]|uniref:hypothetical protein n=1 Tax=Arthrobacter luteolus TaxID=98672 RepID=UPI000AA38D45|nr:hypothetical protein [Arthrobacter luteolus]
MTKQGEKVQHRRGHNAIVTGLAMLVLGGAMTAAGTIGGGSGLAGFSALVAFAGFITLIVGIGIRREK